MCSRLCEGTIISSLVTYLEKQNSIKIKDSVEKCPYLSYLNTQELIDCESPYLFDELFNGRLHRYKNATEYYREISAFKNLANIEIPVLCINSIDDPITPYQSIAYDDMKLNPLSS